MSAYRLDDLGCELLSWFQDSSISRGAKLDSLTKDRCYGTNKNRDNREELHVQKGWKKRRERRRQIFCQANSVECSALYT